jgi:thiamine-monophosphate kinase
VGARLEASRIPAVTGSSLSRGKINALDLAMNGGDDYELLFTVRLGKARRLPDRIGRIPITRIGEVTRERKLLLVQADGSEQSLKEGGWNPFATKS